MNHFVSRAYADTRDLNLLIEFAWMAARAGWPRSTYKKVGDMVWAMPTGDLIMIFGYGSTVRI